LAQGSSRIVVAMACFLRTFSCSNGPLDEKLKIDELEAAVMMLTAQLEKEQAEKAELEERLSEVKTETESLRVKSTSLRAAASMKMQPEDGASEKSAASTAETSPDSDTEREKSEEEESDNAGAEETTAPAWARRHPVCPYARHLVRRAERRNLA